MSVSGGVLPSAARMRPAVQPVSAAVARAKSGRTRSWAVGGMRIPPPGTTRRAGRASHGKLRGSAPGAYDPRPAAKDEILALPRTSRAPMYGALAPKVQAYL